VPAMMTEADEPTETTGLLVNSSQPSMLDSGQPAVPAQTSESGSGWLLSGFIVINAALGAGLLNFPQACHLAGGVGSTLTVQFVLLSFIVGSLVLLAFVSDRSHAATYQEAVASLLGRTGRLASAACIAVYCFGTCITFVIIIGDQWEQISSQFLSPTTRSQPYASKRLVMSVSSLVLILPLCFTKRIDFLKYSSAAGVLGVLYMCVMVVVKYFIGGSSSTSVRTRPHSLVDVFNVVPTICFGYQCHVSVVPVYSCMRRRCLPQFARTVSFAMLICFLAYSATAVFGYWSFGAAVQSDILRNYDATPDVLIGMCLLAFKICTTYPILLFCGRAALDSVALPLLRLDPDRICRTERVRRFGVTIVWFGLTLLLAVLIPNIGDVISLLGSLAAVFIFIFPGLCLFKIGLDDASWLKQLAAAVFLVLGSFIFGVTTVQSISNLI
ncbi:hypothetical protein BOX15_Mlig011399g1, partial [Macrostomum lignano]